MLPRVTSLRIPARMIRAAGPPAPDRAVGMICSID
jgi:hypothetical protein